MNEPVTGMFRKEALEARGRTDALASTIQVTSTGMRSTLVALALVTVGAVAASAYVLVPIQITGNGVLIDHSVHSQASITPSASGLIEALLVRQGEHVVKGQPVARLSLPELANAIPRLGAPPRHWRGKTRRWLGSPGSIRSRKAASGP
ncbi:biotin/lipoyl-binding protein [Rhabdaerophilum sp.]|uniref:biotin/lipoyl-binding protein n=1 Tax=Rhabdaerophilum sp. TaxID=2717341 RepID=UPI0038D45EB2